MPTSLRPVRPGRRAAAPALSTASGGWPSATPSSTRLVDQALQGNPNLQVARARLARAQAVDRVADAAAQAAGRRRARPHAPEVQRATTSTRRRSAARSRRLGTLQLNASWELDFFGKNRTGARGRGRRGQRRGGRCRCGPRAAGQQRGARLLPVGPAERPAGRGQAHAGAARGNAASWCATASRPASTRASSCARAKAACPQARQQIEALERADRARAACARRAGRASPTPRRRWPRRRSPAISRIALQPTHPGRPAGPPRRHRGRALARRGGHAGRRERRRRSSIRTSTWWPSPASPSIGFDNLLKSRQPAVGRGPGRSACRSSRAAGCAPTCAARRPTSTPRSRATTPPCSTRCATSPTRSASVQSIARQQAEQRAAQSAAEAAYDIAVQRYGAGLGNYLNVLTAETTVLAAAPPGRRPGRARARHPGRPRPRAGRRLAAGRRRPPRCRARTRSSLNTTANPKDIAMNDTDNQHRRRRRRRRRRRPTTSAAAR